MTRSEGRGDLAHNLGRKSRQRRANLSASVSAERTLRHRRNDLTPKLELVERDVAELRKLGRRVRASSPDHVREVSHAIATLGFCDPILIDQDDRVLDGWIRLEAAMQLGLRRVPCIRADHLKASERRLLTLALNRLQEKGGWNLDVLRIELEELAVEDVPIEISGFTDIEIDQLLLDREPEVVEKGPLRPEAGLAPMAKTGDIFQLGRHLVACGDAQNAALLDRLMGPASARLVLTDVPYNVPIKGNVSRGDHREFVMASGEMTDEQFAAFNMAWIREASRHLVSGGILGTFIDWRGYPNVHHAATAIGLDRVNLVVWSKTNAGMGSLYRSAHELLPLYKKGDEQHVNNVELGKHGRWRSNVWVYPGASTLGSDARQGLEVHPTVKPVAMLEDAMLDLTHRGDIVLDPFLGSGSTLIAAEKAGRTCYGIELDPLFVDVIIRRFEAATGTKALLASSDDNDGQAAALLHMEPNGASEP